MESTLLNSENKVSDLPCLMINKDNTIVLLVHSINEESAEGTVIWAKDKCEYLGYYDYNWDKSIFRLFTGTITLKQ